MVYSFFTCEFAPMAMDVLALLEFSNAWIDPNLLELVGRNDGSLSKKLCLREHTMAAAQNLGALGDGSDTNDDDDWDDGQFARLCANRIVLKRASHVSDASQSESDEWSPA